MGISAGLEHIIRENESLAPYTRLRMGGPVEYLAEPTDVTELTEVIRRARQEDMSIRLLGGDPERERSEQVHYVGHVDALKSALTVRENLEFWSKL